MMSQYSITINIDYHYKIITNKNITRLTWLIRRTIKSKIIILIRVNTSSYYYLLIT